MSLNNDDINRLIDALKYSRTSGDNNLLASTVRTIKATGAGHIVSLAANANRVRVKVSSVEAPGLNGHNAGSLWLDSTVTGHVIGSVMGRYHDCEIDAKDVGDLTTRQLKFVVSYISGTGPNFGIVETFTISGK